MQTPHTESYEVQHNWISRVRVEGGYIDGLDIELSSGRYAGIQLAGSSRCKM